MAYSNRPSKRPIPGICPCHGSAPHVYEKKASTASGLRTGGRRPAKKGAPQGRRSGTTPGRGPARPAVRGGRR